MHAVVEDNLPQLLPAHNAQVLIILVDLPGEVYLGCLQPHASAYMSSLSESLVVPQYPLAPPTSCKYRLREAFRHQSQAGIVYPTQVKTIGLSARDPVQARCAPAHAKSFQRGSLSEPCAGRPHEPLLAQPCLALVARFHAVP